MNRLSDTKGLGPGVYYHPEAYAGLLLRFLIVVVDLGVIFVAGVLIHAACFELIAVDSEASVWFLASWVATTCVYLVFVESSSAGTLGFLLTGMKIVNLKGDRPSFLRMAFRLLLWCFGPIHPVIDLLWLSGDPDRQTLRDKLAGTYVVRKTAIPCGDGVVRLRQYFLFGLAILFPEVQRRHTRASVVQ
jgi:uncharacterized RDD family membrane protein YckC